MSLHPNTVPGPVEVWSGRGKPRPYILAMTVDAQRFPGPIPGVTLMFGEPHAGGLYWPAIGEGGMSWETARGNAEKLALGWNNINQLCETLQRVEKHLAANPMLSTEAFRAERQLLCDVRGALFLAAVRPTLPGVVR